MRTFVIKYYLDGFRHRAYVAAYNEQGAYTLLKNWLDLHKGGSKFTLISNKPLDIVGIITINEESSM